MLFQKHRRGPSLRVFAQGARPDLKYLAGRHLGARPAFQRKRAEPSASGGGQLTEAQQEAAGAGPNVVRLSIGIEDPADLIRDLDQALAASVG